MSKRELTQAIIGALIEVHKEIGAGLLESAYKACARRELELRGLKVQTEVPLPIRYKGLELDCGYRMDMVVEDTVVLELKAVKTLEAIHEAQLLTYLRLSGYTIGLLVNFNVPLLKDGIKRMVLGLKDD
jgi:GxxExxY protein